MEKLRLNPIERVCGLTKTQFTKAYAERLKPVIITDYCQSWSAREKWNFDYFKKVVGDIEVPLFADAFADTGGAYMKAQNNMIFRDYLQLLETSDTKLRMFLFNLYKKMPALLVDFNYPDIINAYVRNYPFLFFGQQGSHVDLHYDADLSHVLLTQFSGRKKIILFAPEYSTWLYRHPLTVSTNVNIANPDFLTYPKLTQIEGYECILQPNETLFMPSGYWHYIYYVDTGFSLSLRAQSSQWIRRLHGLGNIFKLVAIDYSMGKLLTTKRWYQMKEAIAKKRAEKYVV